MRVVRVSQGVEIVCVFAEDGGISHVPVLVVYGLSNSGASLSSTVEGGCCVARLQFDSALVLQILGTLARMFRSTSREPWLSSRS
jgi:hypothetical protein